MSGTLAARGLALSRGRATLVGPVDFALAPGEFTVLFGPSGAGKTSLLRLLAGLERPTTGGAYLGDERVRPGPRVGCVLQDLGLWPHCSAARHIDWVLSARGVPRAERPAETQRLLDAVALDPHRRAARPHELSGGEAQRVALARALASAPAALLLDEPLSALDALARAPLFERVRHLAARDGRIALYVTHDQDEALSADRILVLDRGRLVADGDPVALYRRPPDARVAHLLGAVSLLVGELAAGVLAGTALGALPAEAAADGAGRAAACLRPEQIAVDAAGPHSGTVRATRHLGRCWRVELALDDGTAILAESAGRPPPAGTRARFRIDGPIWAVAAPADPPAGAARG